MKQILMVTLTLALIATTYSYSAAHGGGHNRLMATISSVSQTELVVVDPQHESHVVGLGAATRYLNSGGEVASREDLAAGMRVVVIFASDGSGAAEIRFAAAGGTHDGDSDSDSHLGHSGRGEAHDGAHDHAHGSGHGHEHDD